MEDGNDYRIMAGGKLLESIGNGLLNIMERNIGNSKASTEIKHEILSLIYSGDWRNYLQESLKIIDEEIMNNQLEILTKNGYNTVDILYYVDSYSYGLAGVGSGLFKAVFEVGLHMDWILGVPFYPGSTIKGAVRFILEDLASNFAGNPNSNKYKEAIEKVMGSNNGASSFIVLDSYPVGCLNGSPCLILTGDVITPHYYKGGNVVSSELEAKPTPIQHIAIAPGTVFRVIAGVRPASHDDMKRLGDILAEVTSIAPSGSSAGALFALGVLIVKAILEGFGARTGKGYNVFKVCDSSCYNNIIKKIKKIKILNSDEIEGDRMGKQGSPQEGRRRGSSSHRSRGRYQR